MSGTIHCLTDSIIKIGQSSHPMYSNNILNFQEPTTILNAYTKKSLETYRMHRVYIYTIIIICVHLCMCGCRCGEV